MDSQAAQTDYQSGKLKKVIAAEYGLTISQVRRLLGVRKEGPRVQIRIALDVGLLAKLRIQAGRNGRLLSREIENLLRLALTTEEQPCGDDR